MVKVGEPITPERAVASVAGYQASHRVFRHGPSGIMARTSIASAAFGIGYAGAYAGAHQVLSQYGLASNPNQILRTHEVDSRLHGTMIVDENNRQVRTRHLSDTQVHDLVSRIQEARSMQSGNQTSTSNTSTFNASSSRSLALPLGMLVPCRSNQKILQSFCSASNDFFVQSTHLVDISAKIFLATFIVYSVYFLFTYVNPKHKVFSNFFDFLNMFSVKKIVLTIQLVFAVCVFMGFVCVFFL